MQARVDSEKPDHLDRVERLFRQRRTVASLDVKAPRGQIQRGQNQLGSPRLRSHPNHGQPHLHRQVMELGPEPASAAPVCSFNIVSRTRIRRERPARTLTAGECAVSASMTVTGALVI